MSAPSEPKASVLSSSVSLINNIVGAGLFSMPWCLLESTVLTGSAAFCVICVLNLTSFMLLAECCDMSGCYSYLQIGQLALGPAFGVAAQLSTMLYAAGSLISYVVLLGDVLVGAGTGVLSLAAGECQRLTSTRSSSRRSAEPVPSPHQASWGLSTVVFPPVARRPSAGPGSVIGDGGTPARAIVCTALTAAVLFPLCLLRWAARDRHAASLPSRAGRPKGK